MQAFGACIAYNVCKILQYNLDISLGHFAKLYHFQYWDSFFLFPAAGSRCIFHSSRCSRKGLLFLIYTFCIWQDKYILKVY